MLEEWKPTLYLISEAALLPVQITAHKHSKHIFLLVLQNNNILILHIIIIILQ